MFKTLMKKFSTVSEDTQQEEVNMTETNEQAQVPADKTAELSAQLETVNAALATATNQLVVISAKYEAAQAALDASEAAKKLLAEQAATKRLESRTEAITNAIGTSQLASLLAATDGMNDESFTTVVNAFAKSFEDEKKSPMFKELGVADEGDTEKEKPVSFNKFIKTKE